MSNWDHVDRARFVKDVADLQKLGRWQNVPHKSITTAPRSSVNNQILPVKTEMLIADDFAFLAAWRANPGSVAAATAVAVPPRSIRVVVAANESIPIFVRDGLRRLMMCLSACASRAQSKQESVRQGLELLMGLHKDRILDRLGCPGYQTKRSYPKERIEIAGRIRLMAKSKAKHNQAVSDVAFVETCTRLAASIDRLGQATPSDITGALETVVEDAYSLTGEGGSLSEKMTELGFDNDLCSRAEVRQIQAIANYKRICEYLVNVSRAYRLYFNNAELHFVEAPPKQTWPARSSQRFFVHAEIQVLIHCQRLPVEERPRYIGISKRPCFLCFHFIRAHNEYATRDSHGEVYNQWTIPANHDSLSRSQRAELASALKQTSNTVRQALQRSKNKNTTGKSSSQTYKQPQQQQSFIDLAIDALRAPSVSTLRSIVAIIPGGEAVTRVRHVPRHQPEHCQTSAPAKTNGMRTASVKHSSPLPKLIRVGRTEEFSCGDMICFLTFEDPKDDEQDEQYGSWRQLGADELQRDGLRIVYVDQLLVGQKISMARGDASPSLSLILGSKQRKD
ncbi:hypothetical protein KC343_g7995 [Hortaea werneckii]|nr:hypothetical protein KC352_g15848 [Hortaea werneckii]KAI7571042.1 hypothetical protein KC317_g1966 [Hortaea werneckii]KAI7619622.1 hypothetical protein KC346_g4473 [Hortaea werneckii]KAI7621509.1 hypothetical protein KC343_g7995 [Hortaea werneckii]KAI7663307.1 hypothetical protein KC319_g7812 [Hortaea werneckii]